MFPPIGDPPRKPIIGDPPRRPKTPTNVPWHAVKCAYCPDPNQGDLRRRASGTRKAGSNRTHVCFDERGKVTAVRTWKSFGDKAVDAVLRDTVRKWRVRPPMRGSHPFATCTDVTFELHFD